MLGQRCLGAGLTFVVAEQLDETLQNAVTEFLQEYDNENSETRSNVYIEAKSGAAAWQARNSHIPSDQPEDEADQDELQGDGHPQADLDHLAPLVLVLRFLVFGSLPILKLLLVLANLLLSFLCEDSVIEFTPKA